MQRYTHAGILAATVIGLAAAIWTIGAVGAQQVLTAMTTIGWLGMSAFILWSVGVLFLLGAAWLSVAPGEPRARLPLFVWARTTREAAADVLPFSQLGGIVVGIKTLTAAGVNDALAYASMTVDLTTEIAAQLLFTLAAVGSASLASVNPSTRSPMMPLALAGVIGMTAIVTLLTLARRPILKMAGRLGARILPGSVAMTVAIQDRLDAIYRHPRRVVAAFVLNLLAWIASAAGAWIALRFMGLEARLPAVIVMEALIFALRSVAFAIPGAIGVQEVAYLAIAPLFGIPPTAALALSLLKRTRDLLIGTAALMIWQLQQSLRLKA